MAIELYDTITENDQWPKGVFFSRCKALEQFRNTNEISILPEKFQNTTIEGVIALISFLCSFS